MAIYILWGGGGYMHTITKYTLMSLESSDFSTSNCISRFCQNYEKRKEKETR